MERISVYSGKIPILVVSPHGAGNDDNLTAAIAEKICVDLNCYGVINRGFERSKVVDVINDLANCNSVAHCHEDVVREEFLEPLMNFVNEMLDQMEDANIFILHGMSLPKGSSTDIVVGFGEGKPQRHSCDILRKNGFIYTLLREKLKVCIGAGGGKFAGHGRDNLNQLYRAHYEDTDVHSMQIEIDKSLRSDLDIALHTGEVLALCLNKYLTFLKGSAATGSSWAVLPATATPTIPKGWPVDWHKIAEAVGKI